MKIVLFLLQLEKQDLQRQIQTCMSQSQLYQFKIMQNRLEQLRSGFKRTVKWNKYQSNVLIERKRQYLDFLIDPSVQELMDFLFYCLKMRGEKVKTGYYLPKVEIKDYNVMIDEKKRFWVAI